MFWCKHCGTEVSEPRWVTEYDIHNEVDDRRTEAFLIPFCPSCSHELEDAVRCACGNWKDAGADWCSRCVQVRDRALMHCIARIRIDTKLALSAEDTRDLMLSYLE